MQSCVTLGSAAKLYITSFHASPVLHRNNSMNPFQNDEKLAYSFSASLTYTFANSYTPMIVKIYTNKSSSDPMLTIDGRVR
jgi:hypothetical protein